MFSGVGHWRGAARAIGWMAVAGGGFLASSGAAVGPTLAMLDRLEPGLWEVRARDSGDTVQICVDNGRKLIQVRHRSEVCKRFIVDDAPTMVAVQYTCPAGGYGRTDIRFENSRLVQLETQGIDKGLPFNFAAEGRRLGSCGK